MNYFERFELALTYEIDLDLLEQKYFALQQQRHPDKYATKPEAERIKALQDVLEINQAYEVLRSDLKRAEYLLQLEGINYTADESIVHNPEILAQAFEDRDMLESIQSDDELDAMIAATKKTLERCKLEFSQDYKLRDFNAAAKVAIEMKYKYKLLDEMLGR